MSKYMESYLGEDYDPQDEYDMMQQQKVMESTPAQAPAASVAPAAAGAGMAAAAGSNPYIAGATIGGSFLTALMAAKAQERAQQKQAIMQTLGGHADSQNQALNSLLNVYKTALR